jgi:hypothetical protein
MAPEHTVEHIGVNHIATAPEHTEGGGEGDDDDTHLPIIYPVTTPFTPSDDGPSHPPPPSLPSKDDVDVDDDPLLTHSGYCVGIDPIDTASMPGEHLTDPFTRPFTQPSASDHDDGEEGESGARIGGFETPPPRDSGKRRRSQSMYIPNSPTRPDKTPFVPPKATFEYPETVSVMRGGTRQLDILEHVVSKRRMNHISIYTRMSSLSGARFEYNVCSSVSYRLRL